MLKRFVMKGSQDACTALKLAGAEAGMLSGLLGKAKAFGAGQVQAGGDLFKNLRGGFGGQPNPDVMPNSDPGMARAAHRSRALGNLKTLAPSLLAGGGLYMMHRHNQQQEEQQRQQAMMQSGYGQPMM
jgi:hypothetical protein